MPKNVMGYALAIIGAILFSSKAIVVKMSYAYGVDAETLLALRLGCSLPIYLIGGYLTVRRDKNIPALKTVLLSMGVGIIGYWGASYTDFIGLSYISANFERLILFTYPLFVVIFGWAFFGGKLHKKLIPAFAISYAGLAFVFTNHAMQSSANAALGAFYVLVCALAFALYQLMAKAQIAVIGSSLFTTIALFGASVVTFAVFFVHHSWADLAVAKTILPHVIFLTIGATVIPTYFMSAALARISAQANGAIGMISPIATIGLSALVLGDALSWIEMIGAVLVIAGVGLFIWAENSDSKTDI